MIKFLLTQHSNIPVFQYSKLVRSAQIQTYSGHLRVQCRFLNPSIISRPRPSAATEAFYSKNSVRRAHLLGYARSHGLLPPRWLPAPRNTLRKEYIRRLIFCNIYRKCIAFTIHKSFNSIYIFI